MRPLQLRDYACIMRLTPAVLYHFVAHFFFCKSYARMRLMRLLCVLRNSSRHKNLNSYSILRKHILKLIGSRKKKNTQALTNRRNYNVNELFGPCVISPCLHLIYLVRWLGDRPARAALSSIASGC